MGSGLLSIWKVQAEMERVTTAAASRLFTELPSSHQGDRTKGIQGSKNVPDKYEKLEPVRATGITLHQAFIQTSVYF